VKASVRQAIEKASVKYTIEKNVPLPARGGRSQMIRDMEPGDSIACDLVEVMALVVTARQLFGAGCCARRKLPDGQYRFWLLSNTAKAKAPVTKTTGIRRAA
jgi:hypothetical protein